MKRRVVVSIVLCVLLALGLALSAQKPARNVSSQRHPNLAAAQQLSREAYDKLLEAQRANEWDLGGHAAKAKELLVQVNAEIKLAVETANAHQGK